MNSRVKELLIHVTGWAIFLVLPLLFAPGPPLSLDRLFSSPFMHRELVAYVLLIIFFYVNTLIFIPKFYFGKKYFIFFLLTFIAFLVTTLVPFLLIQVSPGPASPPTHEENSILFEFGHNFFRFAVVTFISLALTISNRWKKAEQEKLNAELSYLKAQINPHFLFNTLNSIYSLAIQKSDKTAPAVVKLSAMMRYVVSEAHRDFVPLEKELNYIRSYIDLQQVRFGEAIQILFSIKGLMNGKQIAPLILIPFVENAFKHGVNAEEISSIKIDIRVEGNELHFEVFNNKVFIHKNDENKSGLGIENTRGRLQLLYPGRHTLRITDTKNDFLVLLTLHLI